jgi:hypothetical protein
MLNCVMCYTGISAAAGMAADGMKATAAQILIGGEAAQNDD